MILFVCFVFAAGRRLGTLLAFAFAQIIAQRSRQALFALILLLGPRWRHRRVIFFILRFVAQLALSIFRATIVAAFGPICHVPTPHHMPP